MSGVVEPDDADADRLGDTRRSIDVDELADVYKNTTRDVVALVFRCKPAGDEERTSSESTARSG